MTSASLAAYDSQLRIAAETAGAVQVSRLGPLHLVDLGSGRGLVTYRDLDGADETGVRDLVQQVLAHCRDHANLHQMEWKTRGHDRAPGLHETLVEHDFVPDEPESVMIGRADLLAQPVSVPADITVRAVTSLSDVTAMVAMQDAVFGRPAGAGAVHRLLDRLDRQDGTELWVAQHPVDGIVSGGRLEPVAGTEFAGIRGGATREPWRGRGIYRALTSARAHSALRSGKTFLTSDSTELSRPILERSGLVKVSTTTPYLWHRRGAGQS